MEIRTEGTTLVLVGDFDVRCTSEVRWALYDLLSGPEGHVVVDMAGVSGIDLTALRLLAVATRHAQMSGHHLTLRHPGPSVRRMIHLARLAHAIGVERVAATA